VVWKLCIKERDVERERERVGDREREVPENLISIASHVIESRSGVG
jgi:hypothetical protein